MKRLLNYPFSLVLFVQLIIVLLLVSDMLFLATATKLLFYTSAFYSVVLASYTKQTSTKKIQNISWFMSGIILFLASVKLISFNAFSGWYIYILLALQAQFFLNTFFTQFILKISSWIIAFSFVVLTAISVLTSFPISFTWILVLLTIYSLLLVFNLYLTFKAND
jgi:hypothetical protein